MEISIVDTSDSINNDYTSNDNVIPSRIMVMIPEDPDLTVKPKIQAAMGNDTFPFEKCNPTSQVQLIMNNNGSHRMDIAIFGSKWQYERCWWR